MKKFIVLALFSSNLLSNTLFTPAEISSRVTCLARKANNYSNNNSLDSFVNPFQTKETQTKPLAISTYLNQYKINGVAICEPDPNFALLYNDQNPKFTVEYKSPEGDIKTRTYQASIKSLGLKLAFCLNFNAIFIVGTDFDFFNSNKIINLGIGIDCTPFPSVPVVYVPFDNMPGGFLMVGFSLGATMGASIVTGGSLTPITSF